MRPIALLAALFAVIALRAGTALAQTPDSAPDAAPQIGKPVPDFTLKDLAGKPRSLSSLKGRPVVLFFFCGCESC